MAARTSKNNILAGLFLIIALALFVATVITLSSLGDALNDKKSYVVGFSLYDGAEGLEKGAPVKLGGKRVGRVTDSQIIFKPGTQEPIGVDVEIDIRADIAMYEDAVVQLAKPLLGSNSALNIVSVAGLAKLDPTYTGGTGTLEDGERLVGRLGAPGFVSQADYQKIQNIIGRVDGITADIQPQVKPIMEDARASVANIRTVTDDAAKRWPKWGDKVDQTFADFEPIVQSVKDFVGKAQSVINRNEQPINDIVDNVRELTVKAKGEAYEELMSALRRGREGIESFASSNKQMDELLASKVPEIKDLIASANLAAQQLKLATVEIRSAPWRLLYQPTKKELETELLYNSVRSYSMAIAELNAASQSLESVAARTKAVTDAGGTPQIDQKTVDELTARLRSAFERYQQEEKAFLDRWIKQ